MPKWTIYSRPLRTAMQDSLCLVYYGQSRSTVLLLHPVFSAVYFTTLLAAIESIVTSTALPFISHAVNAGDLYIRFSNAYFLTSGISGGANNAATLIGGWAVQGIGGGGINLLIELIVSDLVSLRERGAYSGIVLGAFSLGTAVGPLVGGAIVDGTTWRWIFWINVLVAGVALALHFLFLRVDYYKETAILTKLKLVDYAGNIILVAIVVAVPLASSWGGTKCPWSSYRVLVPLIVGVFGPILFHIYEGMPWVRGYPTLPERVFKRRTPATALIIAFINFICPFWVIYFLPVYFQAVLGICPTLSGVALLPTVLLSVVTGAISGVLFSKWGRHKLLHVLAFGLISLGVALFSRFDRHTRPVEWVLVQAVAAFRLGITNLSSVQADLPDGDTTAATAAFVFMRAYGLTWGLSIPAAIFNVQLANLFRRIGDTDFQGQLSGGNAYSFANVDYSLKLTWQVLLGFALSGFLLCFYKRRFSLRSTIDTEFGLEQKMQSTDPASSSQKAGPWYT
ncbi:MFS general substrate transporter [Xylaria arbuscula]|nr:MFS general substrate transporter [Xylaria arbuscula]